MLIILLSKSGLRMSSWWFDCLKSLSKFCAFSPDSWFILFWDLLNLSKEILQELNSVQLWGLPFFKLNDSLLRLWRLTRLTRSSYSSLKYFLSSYSFKRSLIIILYLFVNIDPIFYVNFIFKTLYQLSLQISQLFTASNSCCRLYTCFSHFFFFGLIFKYTFKV